MDASAWKVTWSIKVQLYFLRTCSFVACRHVNLWLREPQPQAIDVALFMCLHDDSLRLSFDNWAFHSCPLKQMIYRSTSRHSINSQRRISFIEKSERTSRHRSEAIDVMEKDEKRQRGKEEKKVSQPAPRKAKPQKPDEASCLVSQREASMKNKSREAFFVSRFRLPTQFDLHNVAQKSFSSSLNELFSTLHVDADDRPRTFHVSISGSSFFSCFLRFSRHSPTWYLSRENFPFRNAMPTSSLWPLAKKGQ